MTRKLNLGCGDKDLEGYLGVDIVDTEAADVVHDLEEYPYPFDDGAFEEIRLNHVLEHIDNVLRTMEEIHRIGEDGAEVHIEVPYFTSRAAYNDPTHKNFFAYNSFTYFSEDGTYNFYTDKRFEIVEKKIIMGAYPGKTIIQKIANRIPEIWEHTILRSLFPTANLRVRLEVKK